MKLQKKYIVIAVLSLVSLGISILLAYSHYTSVPVPCTITNGCEAVLTSKYSMFLGLPLSVWGIIFNSAVFSLSFWAACSVRGKQLLHIVLGTGALASLVFLFLQFFIIHKVCQYCLTVDLITLFLFLWNLNVSDASVQPALAADRRIGDSV